MFDPVKHIERLFIQPDFSRADHETFTLRRGVVNLKYIAPAHFENARNLINSRASRSQNPRENRKFKILI